MADGRRIVFGTQIIPKQSATQEEASISKYTLDHNRTYGGKGVVEIAATQWGDSWTNMTHQHMHWEDWDDATDISGNRWEDVYDTWDHRRIVLTEISLVPQAGVASDKVGFVYIKNLGTTSNQGLKISMDGGARYTLYLKPGASVAFRGDGSNLEMQDLKVEPEDFQTYIEYIVAKAS
jgi:hypothetical protein